MKPTVIQFNLAKMLLKYHTNLICLTLKIQNSSPGYMSGTKQKYTSKMSCNNIENSNKITAARQTCRLVFSAQKTHWRKRRHRITAEALNNSSLTAM